MKLTVDKTTREIPFSLIEAWCICRGELCRKIEQYDLVAIVRSVEAGCGQVLGQLPEGCLPNAWSMESGLHAIADAVLCQPVTVTEFMCEEIP